MIFKSGSIRAERARAGLNQSQFCKMVGLSKPTLHGIESGTRSIKIETFLKIFMALRTRNKDLAITAFFGEDVPSPL